MSEPFFTEVLAPIAYEGLTGRPLCYKPYDKDRDTFHKVSMQ